MERKKKTERKKEMEQMNIEFKKIMMKVNAVVSK